MATTTIEAGPSRADRVTMFLSLMDPVLPFEPDGDDPAGGWDAAPAPGDDPARAQERS